jgi:hypothetical protein
MRGAIRYLSEAISNRPVMAPADLSGRRRLGGAPEEVAAAHYPHQPVVPSGSLDDGHAPDVVPRHLP